MNRLHEDLLRDFQQFARIAPTAKSLMERISQRLHQKMTRYNWVGFYLVDPADPCVPLVGPFVGLSTPMPADPLTRDSAGAAAHAAGRS